MHRIDLTTSAPAASNGGAKDENPMINLFDEKTDQLQQAVADAKVTLKELNECGDLEDRMEAALAVEDAEYQLSRHLLHDPQEEKPEAMD